MLALEINELKKSFGKADAVKGISFSVKAGEIFGLLGPNGAGKTTTINIITSLESPTSGAVKVFGYDVVQAPQSAKRQLGVVHQEIINSGFFDVEEILEFQSGYYGLRRNKERIDYVLHKLSLFEHKKKKVKQLSGGMKRRLMIAKALVHNPKLLLLDEPTAGVDIKLREDLWNFVRELQAEGMSILLTTHYLEEAEELCHRVGILNKGRIECIGETQEIVQRFTQKSVLVQLRSDRKIQSTFLQKQESRACYFLVSADCSLGTLLEEAQIPLADIEDVKIEEGRLEEAFLRVLGERV